MNESNTIPATGLYDDAQSAVSQGAQDVTSASESVTNPWAALSGYDFADEGDGGWLPGLA